MTINAADLEGAEPGEIQILVPVPLELVEAYRKSRDGSQGILMGSAHAHAIAEAALRTFDEAFIVHSLECDLDEDCSCAPQAS